MKAGSIWIGIDKKALVVFPLLAGLVLVVYSWSISYPVSIHSVTEVVFDHISPLYWFGLALLLSSLYVIASMVKSNLLKLIVIASIVSAMYSVSYFYYLLPGSDSHYFRGLTEYFINTNNLDPLQPFHSYFQWPLFFIFGKMANSLGLSERFFEFLLYAIIGILYAATVYCINQKYSDEGAHLGTLSFFIITYLYLAYQASPFSFSLGLLFALFLIDSHDIKSARMITLTLIIFASLTLAHAFVPTFFILYSIIKYVITKDRTYGRLFLFTLTIYFSVLMFRATIFFPMALHELVGLHTQEYISLAGGLLVEPVAPLDVLAQMFGRVVLIVTGAISGLGFMILVVRRRLNKYYYAIFLSGAIYLMASQIIPILGTRTFPVIALPVALGATYYLKSRFKLYYQLVFLILIVSFTFLPLHSSYTSTKSQIMFQTKEAYQSENFLLDHYNWNQKSRLLSDIRTVNYLATKSSSHNVTFKSDLSVSFSREIQSYDCIMFTIGLEKSFSRYNSTESIFNEINEKNIVYNSGPSYILVDSHSQGGP